MAIKVNIDQPQVDVPITVTITPDGAKYSNIGHAKSENDRVHLLFYKLDDNGTNKAHQHELGANASSEGDERWITVLVVIDNQIVAQDRRLIRDGKK